MLSRAPSLVPINVGSAREVSILELAQIVAKILNPHAVINLACQPSPGSAPSRYVPSVDRAKQLLGLEETVNLEESIHRTRNDPSRRRAGGKWETRSVFQGGFTAVFSTAARGGELCRGSVGQRRVGV